MIADITETYRWHVSVPLAEFLKWAGVPDPENWECPDLLDHICVTIEKRAK